MKESSRKRNKRLKAEWMAKRVAQAQLLHKQLDRELKQRIEREP